MKILLTGGGTGGHLYPGLAVLDELMDRTACEVLFVGTRRGLEAKIIPEKGIDFKTVWISGLRRRRIAANILFPAKMVVSLIQSLWIIKRFKPGLVIGTGGYVTWPVLSAAVLLGKRRMLLEQNRKPGLVTRILAPLVHRVFLSFSESQKHFLRKRNLVVCGNPVRSSLQRGDRKEAAAWFGMDPSRQTVLVFGGSQGAWGINQLVTAMIPEFLNNTEAQMLWATGPRWYEGIKVMADSSGPRITVRPYLERMDLAYGLSHLVVCRSGATSVAEIAVLGLPTLFIPFPAAAGGHQKENARTLVDAGAARLALEKETSPGRLLDMIRELLQNGEMREAMSRAVKRFAKPGAAACIADEIITVVKEGE